MEKDSGNGKSEGVRISRRKFVGGALGAGAVTTAHPNMASAHSDITQESAEATVNSQIAAPPYRRAYPRGQGFDAIKINVFEAPMEDPDYLEVWCYTDKLSYHPGDAVEFHVSTTAKQFSIEIIRDGSAPESAHRADGIKGKMYPLPDDFYEKGCGWPAAYRWTLPKNLPTGFYMVISRAENEKGEVREQEHGFFVRPAKGRAKSDILLVAATSTWNAYNDWGGTSSYVADKAPDGFDRFAPRLTHHHRPFARGLIYTPEGAPRKPHELEPVPGAIPRYPCIEFAIAMGYSRWYPNAGWATYEKPFVVWAERNGFEIDYATQHDLHYDSKLLEDYKCVVFVGHDEYWSWEMRDAVDRYVDKGGNVARFAGNFAWQIRLENDGNTQVCYKEQANQKDPFVHGEQKQKTTSMWEDSVVNRPGEETFGLNAAHGIYAGVGVNVPRGAGGFTVYRPEHWAFEGADIYYGDILGKKALIFGYEVDGLDYTFEDGVPIPTDKNQAPDATQILAMGIASNFEADHGHRGSTFYYGGDPTMTGMVAKVRNDDFEFSRPANDKEKAAGARGNGMIVTFARGKGTVFHAGSCEWVAGLKRRDFATEQVTRNVLNRFIN